MDPIKRNRKNKGSIQELLAGLFFSGYSSIVKALFVFIDEAYFINYREKI